MNELSDQVVSDTRRKLKELKTLARILSKTLQTVIDGDVDVDDEFMAAIEDKIIHLSEEVNHLKDVTNILIEEIS